MRTLLSPLAVLAALFTCILAEAQRPTQRDPAAMDILGRALAVIAPGGAGVRDSIVEGQILFADGSSGPIVIKSRGPASVRFEVTRDGKRGVFVADQGKGFTEDANNKRSRLPLWVTEYQHPAHIPGLGLLAHLGRQNMSITYLGIEDVAGRPAHHIRLWAVPTGDSPADIEEMISEFHVFLDAESLLVMKTISFDFSPEIIENRSTVETYYGDYRPVGGLMVPHRMSRFIAGQKDSEVTVTSVRLNAGLTDLDFK